MSAFWEIAQSNSYKIPNSSTDDIMIYGQSNTQRIVFGSLGNMSLSVGSNDVTTPGGFVSGTSTANVMSTNSLVISKGANVVAPISINNVRNDLAIIVDQKSSGTNGGMGINGWNKRNLNTVYANVNSNVLAVTSDQVWVKTGTYEATFTTALGDFANSANCKPKLRNASTSTDLGWGPNVQVFAQRISPPGGICTFTVSAASNALELYTYCSAATGYYNTELGTALGAGTPEIYSTLRLWRYA
jgi:hypothetical protein